MKVTRKMMNKEVRTVGILIRMLFKFRKKSQFDTCNKMLNKFMKGRYPKNLKTEEKYIERKDKTKLRILVCRPNELKENSTGVLWIHDGGYALGIPEKELNYAKNIVQNTNSVVVLPDYTLSVEKPYPATLEDCYDTLCWMKEHCEELCINKNQLFVAGESAGGGLTAALSFYAKIKKKST